METYGYIAKIKEVTPVIKEKAKSELDYDLVIETIRFLCVVFTVI